MTRCGQPGCSGEILDGYCTVCGMPGEAGVSTDAPTAMAVPGAGAAHPPVVDGGHCAQPGCSGEIADGYCTVCGAPGGAAPLEPAPGDDEASPMSGSGSVATAAGIGSARAKGSGVTQRVRSGSERMRAARLGAGLTNVPAAPPVDAASAVRLNAEVPEHRRVCSSCGAEVGRSVDGRPGRTEGFCPQCRSPYSFDPKLKAGDLVAGQYAVAGPLAHGGLGWIYLARDRNVSDRWVVLKGLLNAGDADALAAAIAEQQFLAQVEHPLIVEIYNFVTHEGAGYIVMEYVGGASLKDILKDRMAANRGEYDPLPVDQALAYVYEVLPAFQYLHDLGLVYCDFKPDNLIQVGDAVKLIDLGGVRRIDDQHSAIYGTVGYQAPEVGEVGPSVASDIYTIGRTLLVLCMEFRGYQGSYVHSLPPVDSTPLFQEYDSLYWLIAKCCAPDPADRFTSADELRVQLLGVLREVVARRTPGTALTSAASVLFASPAIAGGSLDWATLPNLRSDTSDAQHAFVTSITDPDPTQRLLALRHATSVTPEIHLARADAQLRIGAPDQAEAIALEMLRQDPWEWRALWIQGLAALKRQDWAGAQKAFNAVYRQVPGELAPKLALALACERGGLYDVAEGLYATCASTDATYVAVAAFGQARVRAAKGDTRGSVEALDLVPTTSRGYPESRRMRAAILLDGSGDDLAVLAQSLDSIAATRMDGTERGIFTTRILERALAIVEETGPQPVTIGPWQSDERTLRDGLEDTYRGLGRDAATREERIGWVLRANEVRNWSMT
ncbi:MAG: serine/threonine-protein kinase PknG [Intrasporangiaceae bacterium]|nr:serine/threonine-protein kinase PknG [Intrasporangiaceae bacterium]